MKIKCKSCNGIGQIISPFANTPSTICTICAGDGTIETLGAPEHRHPQPLHQIRSVEPVPQQTFLQWLNSPNAPVWVSHLAILMAFVTAIVIIVMLLLFAEIWFIVGGVLLALLASALYAYESYIKGTQP